MAQGLTESDHDGFLAADRVLWFFWKLNFLGENSTATCFVSVSYSAAGYNRSVYDLGNPGKAEPMESGTLWALHMLSSVRNFDGARYTVSGSCH